ncbi:11775_t:CDS:1 [Funneliformis geosporum]|uniref:18558_t:CDS:1 n=1 Tax=Funneliformis geosporum TaxID=1117311 RepID=A0A9W4STZ8_9GLOM|nr:11775_t:CDS:1 [Funneliformis geosporum]CAI2181280.1 18558_t:CDS:1 [Funneliformis geosporum]
METIFGVHHDTASLREKNRKKLYKNDSQEQIDLTNKNSVEDTIQKTTQTKQESSKSFEKFGPIHSIFRERFSKSPIVSPHVTPPGSRPSTPLSFDVQQSGDNVFDQINSSSQIPTPLTRVPSYHHDTHDTTIIQNVKKNLPCVGDIEGDIINRPSSPWSLQAKSGDELGNGTEKNLFKKN